MADWDTFWQSPRLVSTAHTWIHMVFETYAAVIITLLYCIAMIWAKIEIECIKSDIIYWKVSVYNAYDSYIRTLLPMELEMMIAHAIVKFSSLIYNTYKVTTSYSGIWLLCYASVLTWPDTSSAVTLLGGRQLCGPRYLRDAHSPGLPLIAESRHHQPRHPAAHPRRVSALRHALLRPGQPEQDEKPQRWRCRHRENGKLTHTTIQSTMFLLTMELYMRTIISDRRGCYAEG